MWSIHLTTSNHCSESNLSHFERNPLYKSEVRKILYCSSFVIGKSVWSTVCSFFIPFIISNSIFNPFASLVFCSNSKIVAFRSAWYCLLSRACCSWRRKYCFFCSFFFSFILKTRITATNRNKIVPPKNEYI